MMLEEDEITMEHDVLLLYDLLEKESFKNENIIKEKKDILDAVYFWHGEGDY